MLTRTPQVLTALAVGAIVLAPSMPASANQAVADDSGVTIGSPRTLTVDGDGWGHGHGMSQWGAQGAALKNVPYGQILAFYYPGTKLSTLGGGRVKVLITEDIDNNTTVRTTGGLRLTDTGRGKTWKLPTSKHPKAWRLRTKNGDRQVLYKTGRWHRYRPGGHATLKGDGQFSSSKGPVTLRLPSGDRTYRGALRLVSRDTVNVVGMEKYLRGVVPAEAFTSWRPAALQAQAVAARTYAAFERADNASRYFQVYDTTRSQAYRGVDIENANTDAAIVATADRVLRYNGELAFTQFSASSGGWTSTGSQPYLVAKPDTYDTAASGDTNLNWTRTLDVAALETAHPEIGTLKSVQITDRDGDAAHPDDGWVQAIVLTGQKNGVTKQTTISGSEFKSLYGLKSAYFTLSSP